MSVKNAYDGRRQAVCFMPFAAFLLLRGPLYKLSHDLRYTPYPRVLETLAFRFKMGLGYGFCGL